MNKSPVILNQLIINGYKSIKLLELELKPVNILIGSNGVGKSNFISFFKFMRKIVDKDLPTYTAEQGGANKMLHFGKKTTYKIKFALRFKPYGYMAILSPTINDKFIFKNESIYDFTDNTKYYDNTKSFTLENNGEDNSKLPNRSNSTTIDGHIVGYMKNWKVYHFHDTSTTARVKQTCNINDCTIFSSDGANLSSFLRNIRNYNEKSYNQIITTIQRVAPFFQDFILEPEIENKDTIRLKWKHKGSDEYFDANDLSDGTLRFICLTTLLLQPNIPTLIVLDEPELGLHPFALNLLASMFKKMSNKTQIIASTQSITLADNFDIEDIIVVDRVNNCSEFNRLDREKYSDWLKEYSVGEIWQKNLIGGNITYD